jgi:alpha-1,2-mannosyltransferase
MSHDHPAPQGPSLDEPPILDYASSQQTYQRTLLHRIDSLLLQNRAARITLAALLAVILIVPSVQAAKRIRKIDKSAFREGGQRHATALGRWLPSAEALSTGQENPYGYGHWYPNPPFVLMCLVPFWKMGYPAAGIVWAALKVVGFVGSMAYLIRGLSRRGFVVPTGVLVMAGAFGLRPIVSDLQHANLNIFVAVWLALAWGLLVRGRELSAGLLFALAVVTKVTPALLLLYFLYKRRWRVCGGAALGLLLFVVVIPGVYLGDGRNLALLRSWFDMLVAPFALHGWATLEIANQSMYGTLLRLLSNAGILPIEHMPSTQAMAAGMEDMARPASAFGRLLRPLMTVALLGALAWLCRGRGRGGVSLREWLEFALVLLAMLLMGERTWKHHATTLPIVFLIVWYVLTCYPWPDRFRAWCAAGLGVQFLLLVAAGEGIMGDRLADMMLDGGFFCWGLLLCFIQTGVMLFAMRSKA